VAALSWHPQHESLLVSGGSEGSMFFWIVGYVPLAMFRIVIMSVRTSVEVAAMETAHESQVWSLVWHPTGHTLASSSNDTTTKIWSRNRPGDPMTDRYSENRPFVKEHRETYF